MKYRTLFASAAFALCLLGCSMSSEEPNLLPGYLEAEIIEIASPVAGYLEQLNVRRGQTVAKDAALFRLDKAALEWSRDAADAEAKAAVARAADAQRGLRPEEMDVLNAALAEAKAALELADTRAKRQDELLAKGVATQAEYDQSSAQLAQARESVRSLEAQIRLADQGLRELQRAALENVAGGQAAKGSLAQWQADQAERAAPVDAIVQDTLYQVGEWVPAAAPVVLLRDRDALKARFFISPGQLARIRPDETVEILLPGQDQAIVAVIDHVSDSPEYTPPVIFSREQAAKLVFLVEARLPAEQSRALHPGLPVSIRLTSRPDPR